MRSRILTALCFILLCFGVQMNANAQYYGMESNGDGSYTFWMDGGSVTTNTQGTYSATNTQGTYCMGCYATQVSYYTTQPYYSPTYSYQQLSSAPPPSYYSTNVVNNNQVYYNSTGGVIATIPFGTNMNGGYVTSYAEGCSSCAQTTAQQQAANQWNSTNISTYQAQTVSYQQQTLSTIQSQMSESYNMGNAYNYYYYYYAYTILTTGSTSTPPSLPPPPATPPPPMPPLDNQVVTPTNVAKLPAEFQANRVYVAPNGTPFRLPSGAQVGGLVIDMDDFTNGALYSFYVNGIHYMALESFYTRNTGAEPRFGGYYQVVNGRCDLTKPYVINPADYPATNGTVINVVRLRKEQTTQGCKLVQEIATYTMGSQTPQTIPGTSQYMQAQNTDIQFSPAVTAAGSNSAGVVCPQAGTGSTTADLDNYATSNPLGGAGRVASFLNTHMVNTAKIYLYDYTTGKARYVVTKDGVKLLTATEAEAETQKFNSGNFQPTDQDINIKARIVGGKWEYEVKYNNSKISPHMKMSTILPQVMAEIKRQADEEVQKLKSVNIRSQGESVTVEGGEVFAKMGMDLFGALASVYDVGKELINKGRMPENIWDAGKRANNVTLADVASLHSRSPFQMPTIISGAADQLIDEATGAFQLVQTGLEFARQPIKTATNFWNGVKSLDRNKMSQIVSSALGLDNMSAGGDRSKYQGGRYAVQAGMIVVSGLKNIAKGADAVQGAGKNMTDMQGFIPDGSTNHASTLAIKNAATNNKLVTNIDNERLLTKNVGQSGEALVVSMEKKGSATDVFTVKETELVDHRSGTTYTYDQVILDAKDIDKPKTAVIVNNIEEITTSAGQKGGWNKELNNPKASKVYKVTNTNTAAPHKYTTGINGRVEVVDADLKLVTRDRNGYQQSVKCNGAKGGTPGVDQGGHLVGSRFDGAGEQINLVPMTSTLNLSQWKSMENNWALTLTNNPSATIKVKIEVKYDDAAKPLRPTRFIVTETINGAAQAPKQFFN
jgi:hypothetical protein